MKKIISVWIMMFVLIQTSIMAQVHHKMLSGNPEWVYYLQARANSQANFFIKYEKDCFMHIYLEDTVKREGQILQKMMCEVLDMDGNSISPKDVLFNQNPFVLAICREDGEKILGGLGALDIRFTNKMEYKPEGIVNSWANSLLFDFSLNVGDVLYYGDEEFNPNGEYCRAYPIIEKDLTVLNDGTKRYKTTYQSNYSEMYNTYTSIDGIGFINAELPPFGQLHDKDFDIRVNGIRNHFCNLNCFIQNGKVLYIAAREGLENDDEYEGSTRFRPMPFYPDITPEGVADGIDGVASAKRDRTGEGNIYNVQGQSQDGLQRGVNIVDGRKVLVK